MSGSSGIGQLLKGIIMGIVLILAIIGSMSLLDNNKSHNSANNTSEILNSNIPQNTVSVDDIKAPDINITQQKQTSAKTDNQNFLPVLEGETNEAEKKAEEAKKQAPAIKYGILKLSALNPENREKLSANFIVFDHKDHKIAESNNSNSASYRLPIGSYKVITTLVEAHKKGMRKTVPVEMTKTITVSENKLTNEVFELEPAPTIGVLQVSAINAKNNQPMKANFIIQKENGEVIASRSNITHSLFKLKAGSYKVIAKSGINSDFRTIVVEPGESVSEIFKLQEAFLQGIASVRILDINSNKPVPADIEISNTAGKIMQNLKAVSQTEISLAAGNYLVKVTNNKETTSQHMTINAGQQSNQLFHIDGSLDTSTTESVQINDNVKISATNKKTSSTEQTTDASNEEKSNQTNGYLKLFSRNGVDQKPIKSNFYVQTPNGINITKKIYAESAEFKLKPGKYKITVRSKNRATIVKNFQISSNQAITEVFSMQRNTPLAVKKQNQHSAPAIIKTNKVIPSGFLNVVMRPAKKSHFIISDRKGNKIVELTSVAAGNFKLDTGIYTVTAILNGQRQQKNIQVYKGEKSNLTFNASSFQRTSIKKNTQQKGILKSRIIDNYGRPLRGNLSVLNMRGQVIATANNTAYGEFKLPAAPHTIRVNFRGLSGSERINIKAGKTTVQTFTISLVDLN